MLKKSSKRLSNVDDWNNIFSKSIKEKVKQDLFVVFDDEERNFEENLPSLNQNVEEFMGKDFIKYISETNSKKETKKNAIGGTSGSNTKPESKNKYNLYSNIEYHKLDVKVDTKKEDFKMTREVLCKLQADREDFALCFGRGAAREHRH